MTVYEQEINLYFELKDAPASSRESYLRRINTFLKYTQEHKKKPEEITEIEIQQFILYLKNEKELSAGTINNYTSAIKFFYTHVLGKEWDPKKIPRMKRRQKLPVVPPKGDIIRLINEPHNIKHKALLNLLYGSGLRVSEVVELKIGNICSKTMRVRVEKAKHDTTRYTILSEVSLKILREYFRKNFAPGSYTRDDWLFPGDTKGKHINVKTIKNTIIKLRNQLDLPDISAHTLRHAFSTHSLENGVDIAHIQNMLGHKHQSTTMVYLRTTSKSMMKIKSPLDIEVE